MPIHKSKSNFITDRLRTLIIWLIGVTVAVVPLWVPTYVFIGIGFNKAVLFYILVTILILLYLGLIWRDKSYLPKFNLIGWSFIGLVGILAVTTITSVQPYLSFWGTFNRMDGLLMWLYYLIFFIIATSVLNSKQAWWRVISISLVGTALVVIYGLGQLVHWPGVVLPIESSAGWYRIGSTLDNPVFLGGYLALVLPITLAWALTRTWRQWRWVGLLIAILEIVLLLFTWSRGAWLGAMVGGLVFIVTYLYYFKRSWAIRIIIGLVVGLGLLLGGLGLSQILPEQSLLHTASQYFLRTDSIGLRYQTWKITQQAIYEKPLLGWGLENFSVAFDGNYQVSRERNVPFSEAHNDRPHNEYLGMAINGGVFGLLAYIMLLFSAIWLGYRQVIKSVRQQKTRVDAIFYLGCLATVIAYGIFAMTAFQLVDIILYLLIALAGLGQVFPTSTLRRGTYKSILITVVCFVACISIIGLSYWSVIKPLSAVHLADKGTIVFQQQKFSESWQFFQKALAQESYLSNPIRVQMVVLADSYRNEFNNQPEFNNFQRQLANLLPANHKTEPYNSYHYFIFGLYYGHLAEVWPEFLIKSEDSFKRSIELAPRKAETYWQQGNIYGQLGDLEKARANYIAALDLEPANWTINYHVGSWYLIQGDLDQGHNLIQRALTNGYMPRLDTIKPVIQFLEEKGKIKQVEQIYQALIANGRTYPDLYISISELAQFYKRHNQPQATFDTAKQLLDFNFSQLDYQNLVNELTD